MVTWGSPMTQETPILTSSFTHHHLKRPQTFQELLRNRTWPFSNSQSMDFEKCTASTHPAASLGILIPKKKWENPLQMEVLMEKSGKNLGIMWATLAAIFIIHNSFGDGLCHWVYHLVVNKNTEPPPSKFHDFPTPAVLIKRPSMGFPWIWGVQLGEDSDPIGWIYIYVYMWDYMCTCVHVCLHV